MRRRTERLRKDSAYRRSLRDISARYEGLVTQLSLLRRIDECRPLMNDTDALCNRLVRVLASELHVENCSIMLSSTNGDWLELRAAASPLEDIGLSALSGPQTRFRLGEGIAGRVAQTGVAAYIDDVRKDPAFLSLAGSKVRVRALACLPLRGEGAVIGVLNVSHLRTGFLTDMMRQTLDLIAERMASVLATHRLYYELRESELRCRELSKQPGYVVLVFDASGNVLSASPEIEDITGFPSAKLLSGELRWDAGIHPEDRESFAQTCRQVLQGENTAPITYRYQDHHGTDHFLEQTTLRIHIPIHNGMKLVAVLRDMTNLQRAEEEWRAGEALLALLMDSIPDTIYFKDTQLRFTKVNRAFADLLRLPGPEATLGKDDSHFFLPEHARRAREQELEILKSGRPLVDFLEQDLLLDGRTRWVSTTQVPIRDRGGAIIGLVGISRDVTERRRMEEALRESEAKFRTLAETTAVATFIFDGGRLRYVNPAAQDLSGYKRDELLNTNVWELIHPESKETIRAWETTRPHPAASERFEVKIRTKNGQERWCDFSAADMEYEGRVVILGTAFDITERKHAEAALRQSEEKFRAAYKSIPLPTYTWKRQGDDFVLLDYNDAGFEVTQGGISRLLGQTSRQLYPHLPDVCEDMERCFREQRTIRREVSHRLISPDTQRCLNVAYVFVPPDMVMVHTDDVTKRKQAEEVLMRRENVLAAVAYAAAGFLRNVDWEQNVPEILTRLGRTTQVSRIYVFENERRADGTLLTNERFTWIAPDRQDDGLRVKELDYAAEGFTFWAECLAAGKTVAGKVAEIAPPLRTFLMAEDIRSIALVPILAGKEWWGFIGFDDCRTEREWAREEIDALRTAADILAAAIERQRAERTIAEQRLAMVASARLSSLGVLASGVAHEINNPLAVISIGAEQLEKLVQNPNSDRTLILATTAKVRHHVTRIERIVRGLRNLSRDGSSDPTSQKQVLGIIEESLDLCQSRFRAHGIEIVVRNVADNLWIECRPTLLSQVFMNLMNNAYDAVERLPEKWVHIDVEDCGDTIVLSVTDSGNGIPPELREKILEPFFTTKEFGKGTGLGLSISKAIIESHGGSLRIDTECPNTRFVIELPKLAPPHTM